MKHSIIFIATIIMWGVLSSITTTEMNNSANAKQGKTYNSEYDVANIYKRIDMPSGTYVAVRGYMEEVDYAFIKTKIDAGKYSVRLKRDSDSRLYRVDNTDIFLELKYCYEYGYYSDAILIIDSPYSWNKGKVIFK